MASSRKQEEDIAALVSTTEQFSKSTFVELACKVLALHDIVSSRKA